MVEKAPNAVYHVVSAAHPRAMPVGPILQAFRVSSPHISVLTSDVSQQPIAEERSWQSRGAVSEHISSALRHAITAANVHDELLLICGSVFLLAEARRAFGVDEAWDDLQAKQILL